MDHGTAAALRPPRPQARAAAAVALLLVPVAGCALRPPDEVSAWAWGGEPARVASAEIRTPVALPMPGHVLTDGEAGAGKMVPAPKPRPIRAAGARDVAVLQALVDRARMKPAAIREGEARFAWPVAGKILTAFGRQPNGSRNDGIDIAAPGGATVLAAEAGTVVYAGTGVAGQGSMLMVRHGGDYTTVYAHAHELLVETGDQVARRQPIARLDRENGGSARLHFQLRSAGTPLDPTLFLLPDEAVMASIQHPSQQPPGWRDR